MNKLEDIINQNDIDIFDEEELEYIEELYDDLEMQMKELNKKQKETEKDIITFIALTILVFVVKNEFMTLSKGEQLKMNSQINNKLNKTITEKLEYTLDNLTLILSNTCRKTYKRYNMEISERKIKKLIKRSVNGSTLSKRVWNHENKLKKELNDLLFKFYKGEISINDIKSKIQDRFKAERYRIDNLIDDQIQKAYNEIRFEMFKKMHVKHVMRNSVFCLGTCEECATLHGTIYELDKAPEISIHCRCKCFYSIVD